MFFFSVKDGFHVEGESPAKRKGDVCKETWGCLHSTHFEDLTSFFCTWMEVSSKSWAPQKNWMLQKLEHPKQLETPGKTQGTSHVTSKNRGTSPSLQSFRVTQSENPMEKTMEKPSKSHGKSEPRSGDLSRPHWDRSFCLCDSKMWKLLERSHGEKDGD